MDVEVLQAARSQRASSKTHRGSHGGVLGNFFESELSHIVSRDKSYGGFSERWMDGKIGFDRNDIDDRENEEISLKKTHTISP